MYRKSPIPSIVWIVILFLMMLDARILGAVICIPAGALMLSQCHKAKAEESEKYDPIGFVGGIGMLFFGLCIIINYLFIK
ncbi:MAG: hypothetical protein IJ644_02005 [Oscillospiraceae bacterium]|nr:hypothetical protein [Oscillospiraceae bacterium]